MGSPIATTALGFFTVGQFAVRKKNEPNLTNLTKPNLN